MKTRKEKIITKARRPNFTNKEVNILLEEVAQDPELSRAELGGSYQTSLELRIRNRWNAIASKINYLESMNRTGEEVKSKFLNMKMKTKKKAAEIEKIKEEIGDDEPNLSFTDLEKTVLDILEKQTVTGMQGAIEIPAVYVKTEMLTDEMQQCNSTHNVLQPKLEVTSLKVEKEKQNHDLLLTDEMQQLNSTNNVLQPKLEVTSSQVKKEIQNHDLVKTNMVNSFTKARRPNFTHGEVNILLGEVSQDLQLSRGELGGSYQNSLDLRNRWDEIASKINSVEDMDRTGEEVKNKFGDMKTKTKKKAAEIKKHREETGDDEPSLLLTDVEETVLSIIGKTLGEETTSTKTKTSTNTRQQFNRSNTRLKFKNKEPRHNLKRRKHDLLTRNLLANQKSILRQMQMTNHFLRKLVVLKKKEVDLISTNTFM